MNSSLRILLVLPLYGGSLPIGRFCATALKNLGHVVEVFEAPDFYPSFSAIKKLKISANRLDELENDFLQIVSQAVLAKAESFEPDLVFCMAQAPLSRSALKQLSSNNILTAMWFMEDHRLFTYWKAFAPYYDFFAVIQKEPILDELKKLGVNGLYLPLAALGSFHQKQELSVFDKNRFGADLSFMGAGYPNRRVAFRQLAHFDFKIWGTEWDGEPLLAKNLQLQGARISPEDCVKIYNATKINLNLHSSVHTNKLVTGGDFVNPRTFELASCEAFQLVDRRTLLPELFTDKEVVSFDSMEELMDLIPTYLNNEGKRSEIASLARSRVLAEHTYEHRMNTLIETIAGVKTDWPKKDSRYQSIFKDMPKELAAELSALLDRLQLPASTSFTDLVWAVRSEAGALTELETSLLFLDEWRKQYMGGA